ncbi:MAG: type II toxin-antitoxin system HicB family antitoxin [Treponemataceae bacterium]|nr:MAG: type II toxin-antitoxin system HicB family antitoxin [Treponemataceae bacterium]
MRKLTYAAVFENNGGNGYGVFFPDVPGCITCGDNFEHAEKMAKEALNLHLYGLEKDGEALPERLDKIPELAQGDFVVPISVYPDMFHTEMENRREKTTISLPHWIKAAAEKDGINFSRLLEAALKDALNIA